MTITLEEAARSRVPSSRYELGVADGIATLRAPRTLAEELLASLLGTGAGAEASFELASHGGFVRSVTGTVAYVDDQAQTVMVRVADGELARVPLRDVTLARVGSTHERDAMRRWRDEEGFGWEGPVLGQTRRAPGSR